jgi:hypothetical protein
VPVCDLIKVRESQANYQKAKQVLEDSWSEIQELTKFGNQVFPNSFTLPEVAGRIQVWISEQDSFFKNAAQAGQPSGVQDFQALKDLQNIP